MLSPRKALLVLVLGLFSLSSPVGPVATNTARAEATCEFVKQTDVPAAMRDGTILYSDIYRPTAPDTYPVILMRLPYDKSVAQTYVYAPPGFYASHCYIVIVQDVRGQYTSEGFFYTFRDEMQDGYDTIEWAAGLPGSNGKVGMYGFSYVGATQWLPATLRPPHLVAIVPAMTGSDYYEGWTYQNGAFSLAFIEAWPLGSIARSAAMRLPDGATIVQEMDQASAELLSTWYWYLPIKDFPPLYPDDPRIAPYFYDWIRHPSNDDYWRQWSIRLRWGQITVPALNFDGWYDVFLNGAIENFNGMRKFGGSETARRGQHLVIGPWKHLPWTRQVGELDFGPEADNPIEQLQLRWFDYWLKGIDNGVDREQPVRVFVMGANKWRYADDWPIPGTIFQKYYLRSAGAANSLDGDGWLSVDLPGKGRDHPKLHGKKATEAPTDRYSYDPANPVPSIGGHFCCAALPEGPYDQRPVEQRADVLVYSTPPLTEPVEVTGPITVTLYAASSAIDTDFTAKLVDVYPDGRAINLNDGIQRARYRDSDTTPELIRPGKIYRYTIHVWPTSNLFKVGHQIRLEISSSNFPAYDRNPNTGHAFGQDTAMHVADQTIYHDPAHPSHIILPIMPVPVQ
jgi:uncharacterized protein